MTSILEQIIIGLGEYFIYASILLPVLGVLWSLAMKFIGISNNPRAWKFT
jgi:hypothetical protein